MALPFSMFTICWVSEVGPINKICSGLTSPQKGSFAWSSFKSTHQLPKSGPWQPHFLSVPCPDHSVTKGVDWGSTGFTSSWIETSEGGFHWCHWDSWVHSKSYISALREFCGSRGKDKSKCFLRMSRGVRPLACNSFILCNSHLLLAVYWICRRREGAAAHCAVYLRLLSEVTEWESQEDDGITEGRILWRTILSSMQLSSLAVDLYRNYWL